ncbi:cell wall hydrolase [Clostridium vitabionis]|uniref:cell wall hydrolase n=1 Tax=Clostridium vitabionis TaxID=2784388 RepID=UPI00188B922E|nr:cell wall hydrolase [Clostridium vitabionis]
MQMFCEILQAACYYIREFAVQLTKKMYRNSAVFLSAITVVTVFSFSSNSYGGAGRSAVSAHLEESSEAGEDSEGIPPDGDAAEVMGAEDAGEAEEKLLLGAKTVGAAMDSAAEEALESRSAAAEKIQPKVAEQKQQAAAEAEKQARKERAVIRYDDYDLECLEHIVQAEAGGEDAEGRLLVANVIVNRVKSSEFPNDLYDVIYQKGQFQPVANGEIDRVTPTEETKKLVERALEGEDHSGGALYFMNREEATRMNARWFDGRLTFVMSHGGHEFYR